MNYRHAYHAGNFADVLKHIVLARVIEYLKRKEAPFRIIDTHAGLGRYVLDSPEASKTREWEAGIGRLLGPGAEPLAGDAAHLVAPYLDAVRAQNKGGGLQVYPGSPLIARTLMRDQDRLIANELHPDDAIALRKALGRDRRVKVLTLDGWVAARSLLPPKERRGMVLIDPPFEQTDEFERLAEALAAGLRRFATGVFLAWFPIKDPKPVADFYNRLQTVAAEILRVELRLDWSGRPAERLTGCGLIVVNPPYALKGELEIVLPAIAHRLGSGRAARFLLDTLFPAPEGKAERKSPAARRAPLRTQGS